MGILNGVLGLMGAGLNNEMQSAQNKRMLKQQIKANKEMALFNQGLALDMWEKTGYGAQKRQMKEAGLNPALMYGMGGGGGQTASIPGGQVSAQGAQHQDVLGQMGMALQLEILKAQKENIEADTGLKQADTEKKKGVDTELANTQIKSLTQGINNQKAVEELTKVETWMKETEGYIQHMTAEHAINYITWQSEKMYAELEEIQRRNNIQAETYDEQVKTIQNNLALSYAEIALKKAQVTKTDQETSNLAKQILIAADQLKNEQDKTQIQKKLQEFETSFGGQASQILGNILPFLKKGKK